MLGGFLWWKFFPLAWCFPLQIVLTLFVYAVLAQLDRLLNPGVPRNNDLTQYYKVRDLMRTGDVIAFGGKDIFAKLVRKITGGNYSHVGMVVKFDDLEFGDRVFILESITHKGVVLMLLSSKLLAYNGIGVAWYPLAPKEMPSETPKDYRNVIRGYLMQQLGKNYDYRDIQYFVKKFIFRFQKIQNVLNDPNRVICSELVARALQTVHLCTLSETFEISPAEIVALDCLAKPGTKIL